jgi:hypothetical protein
MQYFDTNYRKSNTNNKKSQIIVVIYQSPPSQTREMVEWTNVQRMDDHFGSYY